MKKSKKERKKKGELIVMHLRLLAKADVITEKEQKKKKINSKVGRRKAERRNEQLKEQTESKVEGF
jgi:hypothetical protein